MIVVPQMVMNELMTQIVRATHSLEDVVGRHVVIGTINEAAMRSAALIAITIATGRSVWPGDEPIQIPERQRTIGIFREGGA